MPNAFPELNGVSVGDQRERAGRIRDRQSAVGLRPMQNLQCYEHVIHQMLPYKRVHFSKYAAWSRLMPCGVSEET